MVNTPLPALVTGFDNSTGVGMVAIYDADDGDSYLKNIATRSWVGTGNLISIGGFVITGDVPKQILVRGLGPSMENTCEMPLCGLIKWLN